MADELKAQFDQASQDVKVLSKAPDNEILLKLYALFKQGTKGDCTDKRPGLMDFVGRAKFDAWKALEGTSSEDAMRQYVSLVDGLKAADK